MHQPPRELAIVLNPVSGHGRGSRRRAALEALLQRSSLEAGARAGGRPPRWRILETTGPGAATALARVAALDGADLVVAAGGDGTCGEVVNGLIGSGARLGVLPLGSGNDFARALGVPVRLDAAVRLLFEGETRTIDAARAGERWFVSTAGCGLDAVVGERIRRGYAFARGSAAYLLALVEAVVALRAADFAIDADGQRFERRAILCTVANGPTFGGGMRIAPDARLDDGLLDGCVVAETGRIEFLRSFLRVYRGTHVTHPKVTMLRARRVQIECSPPMPVLIDGDVRGTTPLDITAEPGALRVVVPGRPVPRETRAR